MKTDCLFCQIAAGETETPIIWENEVVVAFMDIVPKAPIHALVVSRQHVRDLSDLTDADLAGQLIMAARQVANHLGIAEAYRFHINNGRAAGQVIDHLHIHLLGQLNPELVDVLRHEGLGSLH
jgi:histidine triad (HIT) family protein